MKLAWLPVGLREGLRSSFFPQSVGTGNTLRRQTLRASSRSFTTPTGLHAGIAAPEIKFKGERELGGEEEASFYARLIPQSPSYFTTQPNFTDDLLALQALLRKYSSLPVVKPGEVPRVAWRPLAEYKLMIGESIKATKYQRIVKILQRLNHIHPSLKPEEVKKMVDHFKRDINPYQQVLKIPHIDREGRAQGVGRRKSSTARAWLVEGTGEVLVNGKTLADAFGRIHDRESVVWALKATDRINKYNVWALVTGGGTTGQAEALTLAVGKALLAHEPALKPALRRAGCVTRDPRRVERKKPGHVKARKMPAWVKR